MNWDFIYRDETRDLDDAARSSTVGSFIRLPGGCTHYELAGPETGRPIVLVHGFSVPYFIWDSTFATLTSSGHRALRSDLLGRGFSDRPRAQYGLDLFVQQLTELLDALQFQTVDLVGLSMGGAISTAFAARFPGRVRRLALIDPIGTDPMPTNLFYKAALLPGLSELVLGLLGTETMVRNLASDFFDPSEIERFQEQYGVQMQFRGFKRALISTIRNGAVNGSAENYSKLAQSDIPVLLVWGREDRTLPLEQSGPILKLIPRTQFHVIEGAGHIPNCEKPEITHSILLNFLDSP